MSGPSPMFWTLGLAFHPAKVQSCSLRGRYRMAGGHGCYIGNDG